MESHDIKLKEASVVLTKLDDKDLFHESKTLLSENSNIKIESFSPSDKNRTEDKSSITICQGSRKRKRKNTIPQRKIKRTDEYLYDDTDDSLSTTWRSVQSLSDRDYQINGNNIVFPFVKKTRNNTNDDLNMYAYDLKNVQCEKQENDTLKLSKTPIFVKKSKQLTGTDTCTLQHQTNESSSTTSKNKMATCSTSTISSNKVQRNANSGHIKTERVASIMKRRLEKKAPNILSRTNRLQNKSLNSDKSSKHRSRTLVEIRPKTQNTVVSNLKTNARTAFVETLNKQIKSPVKIADPSFPVTRNKRAEQLDISKSDLVVNHVTSQSPTLPGIKSLKTTSYSKTKNPHVSSSMNSPLTINQYASSCEVSTAIKPPSARPHYSSRLRSKSGTKYIVRKDSIITADIADIVEAELRQRSLPEYGGELIIPEKCINNKNIYNHFVKKSNSSFVDNVANDGMQGSSGIQSESPKPNFLISQNSPVFRYTHNKVEFNSPKEKPILLLSKGGLEDIKREMNIRTSPKNWKVSDRQTIPESLQTMSAEINSSTKVPPRSLSIKERYSAYLEEERLYARDSPKGIPNNISNQETILNKVVQPTEKLDWWFEHKKLKHRQSNEDMTRIDMNTMLQNKWENNNKRYVKLDKIENNILYRESSDINQCTSLKHGLRGASLDDPMKGNMVVEFKGMKQDNDGIHTLQNDSSKKHKESHIKSFKIDQIKQEPKDCFNETLNIINNSEEFGQKCKIKEEPAEDYMSLEHENHRQNGSDKCFLLPTKMKKESLNGCENTFKAMNRENTEIKVKQELSLNDHAYTLPEKVLNESNKNTWEGAKNIPTVVNQVQAGQVTTFDKIGTSPQKQAPIPVFAVRCGEKVVLFPASNAINLGKVTTTNAIANTSTVQPRRQNTPSKTTKGILLKKDLLERPEKQQTDFAKKCGLNFAFEPKCKNQQLLTNDLVTTNFKTVVNKRPRNQMKHMCAIVVQITRSKNNIFSFSKDIMALSFTNGSNPLLVRWHKDGIHVTMVTFNNQSKIQHLTVDFITPGFYTLNLKNDPGVRKSRTFEGLLTSTLPNEELLHSEKYFLAIGQIKNIMDPTISKTAIKSGPDMTLSEALSDVLPSTLAHLYNPSVSDRSYRPKCDDKNWYSKDKFETFTMMYGRTRAYHTNGCRLPGEEVS